MSDLVNYQIEKLGTFSSKRLHKERMRMREFYSEKLHKEQAINKQKIDLDLEELENNQSFENNEETPTYG